MILLAGALLLLAAGQPTDRYECIRDPNVRGCAEEQARAFQRLYGTRSIEAHRDAGDQARRVYYIDGNGEDVVAISFIWPRGGDPVAVVQFPRERNGDQLASLQAAVPLDLWTSLVFRSANFDRAMPPRPDPPGSVSICLHPWQYTIEAADPPGGEEDRPTIRRRTENSCEDGFASAFAVEARRAALPLFPACAQLALGQYRNEAHLLAMCGRLQGDRLTAAMALNQANEMREVDSDSGAADLRRLFANDVAIDWGGQRATGRAAAELWAAKVRESNPAFFFVRGARGEDRSSARITGWIRRFVQPARGAPYYERAPVQQLWRLHYGRYVMASATVGAFAREPARAD